ncbi:MAG: hypothetical protein WCD79_22710 [Chthoniobacteraceae bacterium]
MKYFSLHTLILTGLAVFLTGCYRDYDLTRSHDIYRMHYNYTPPAPAPDQGVPPQPAAPGAADSSVPASQPAVPPQTITR